MSTQALPRAKTLPRAIDPYRGKMAAVGLRAAVAINGLLVLYNLGLVVGAYETVPGGGPGIVDRVTYSVYTLGEVLFVFTAVLFLYWQYRARVNLDALGVQRLRSSPAFGVIAWFIPLGNSVFPYEAIAEIWRASEPGPAEAWKRASARPVLRWWLLWLLYATLYVMIEDNELGFSWPWLWDPVVVGLTRALGVVTAWQAIRIIRTIDAHQAASFALLEARPRGAPHAARVTDRKTVDR